MKWGFAKKVMIKSQRQFMYGSNFYESDVTSLFSFYLESLASVTLLILVYVLLSVKDLKWGHDITASELTIIEVYFYHKAFNWYMFDVMKARKPESWDNFRWAQKISWLNLQTGQFGFLKKAWALWVGKEFCPFDYVNT